MIEYITQIHYFLIHKKKKKNLFQFFRKISFLEMRHFTNNGAIFPLFRHHYYFQKSKIHVEFILFLVYETKKPFYNTSREKISPLKIKDSLFVPIKAAKLQTDEDFPTAIAKSAIKHCTFDLLNQGCFRKHQWEKGRQGQTTPKRAIGGDVT